MTRIPELIRTILDGGALGAAVTIPGDLPPECRELTDSWIAAGHHAGMEWIRRHAQLRRDSEAILPGTKSIISIAFGINYPLSRPGNLPGIARYAAGEDYHSAIRDVLSEILEKYLAEAGINSAEEEYPFRICIDSAPVAERYLAVKSGLCTPGRNGAAIFPGYGARIILAEIYSRQALREGVWRRAQFPSGKAPSKCLECGFCLHACPTGALQKNTTVDARRCLSYLTIEHRGDWSSPEGMEATSTPAGKNTLFGCDRCIEVCPMNITPSDQDVIPELLPLPFYADLTPEDIIGMTPAEFRRLFKKSPLMRARYEGLQRNALNSLSREEESATES